MTTDNNDQVKKISDWFKRNKFTAVIIIAVISVIYFSNFLESIKKINDFFNPTPTATPNAIPVFSGEIGQLENGQSFVDFIFDHQGKPVKLDAYIREDQFYGKAGKDNPYLIIWSECNSLSKPLDNSNCTGYYFQI